MTDPVPVATQRTPIYLERGGEALFEWLAQRLAGRFVATTEPPPSSGWYLAVDGRGLALRDRARRGLFRPTAGLRRRAGRSAIARACGARPGLVVLDAMAGWGIDGLALSAAGCAVTMTESHPVVFAMMAELVARNAGSVQVQLADARVWMPTGFDVIYLDPMFEARTKNALPKKPMQVLREIVGGDPSGLEETLALARRHARERVVLKRRAHARPMGSPDWRIAGRTVRFDVYRPLSGGL